MMQCGATNSSGGRLDCIKLESGLRVYKTHLQAFLANENHISGI